MEDQKHETPVDQYVDQLNLYNLGPKKRPLKKSEKKDIHGTVHIQNACNRERESTLNLKCNISEYLTALLLNNA